MKKTILLIAIFCVQPFAHAEETISGSALICSDKPKTQIVKKLQSVEKFNKIDDGIFVDYAFYKAQLLHSKNHGQMKQSPKNLIQFVIEPAPILDLSSINEDYLDKYPKFLAACSIIEKDTTDFECEQVGHTNKYAIDHFKLSVHLPPRPREGCETDIKVSYEIEVNKQEYQDLVKIVNSESKGWASIIGDLNDHDAFFSEFMNAFIYAFEKQDWENTSE